MHWELLQTLLQRKKIDYWAFVLADYQKTCQMQTADWQTLRLLRQKLHWNLQRVMQTFPMHYQCLVVLMRRNWTLQHRKMNHFPHQKPMKMD